MAYVVCTPSSCTITRPDKEQQITLSVLEWRALNELADCVTQYMLCPDSTEPSQTSWTLPKAPWDSSPVETRLSINQFEGGRYAHIRVYFQDKPTKQGVTLNRPQWYSVQKSLTTRGSGETATGRQVYTRMLKESFNAQRRSNCLGCERGWNSQKDHSCILTSRTEAANLLAQLQPPNECVFSSELARLMGERSIPLDRPGDCYILCKTLLRQEIEDAVLNDAHTQCPPKSL